MGVGSRARGGGRASAFARTLLHFSTLHVLGAPLRKPLAPAGAQTCFPAGAPLRRQGRKCPATGEEPARDSGVEDIGDVGEWDFPSAVLKRKGKK